MIATNLHSIQLEILKAKASLKKATDALHKLGYTDHEVYPEYGDTYWVAVHPEYLEVFKNQYNAFAGFDPALNVPEWAIITL